MELKLKKDMYIRTNEGIRKIINEYEKGYELDVSLHYLYPEGHDLYKEDLEEDDDGGIVTKASFDVIDLIEEGDYVNGYVVAGVTKEGVFVNSIIGNLFEIDGDSFVSFIFKEDIESIVTKRQFASMQYKLGGW